MSSFVLTKALLHIYVIYVVFHFFSEILWRMAVQRYQCPLWCGFLEVQLLIFSVYHSVWLDLLLIHFLGVSGSSIGWTLGSLLPISPWFRWHDNLSNALWNRLFLSPFWSKFYSDIGNTNLVLIFRWLELCFSVWWGFLSRLWPGGGKLGSFLAKSIDMINMHYQCIFIIRRYFSQMSKNITL